MMRNIILCVALLLTLVLQVEGDRCKDAIPRPICFHFKTQYNGCNPFSDYHKYMFRHCRETCAFCSKTCEDTLQFKSSTVDNTNSTLNCQYFEHHCNEPLLGAEMIALCPVTCGMCEVEEVIQAAGDITTFFSFYYKTLNSRAEFEQSAERIRTFFNKPSPKHAKAVLSRRGRMKWQRYKKYKNS